VIQLGAILTAAYLFFAEAHAKFLSTFPKGERGDRTVLTHPLSLVMIAYVVTAGPAFLMTKVIGKHLESLTIIGTSLAGRRNRDVDCGCAPRPRGRAETFRAARSKSGIWRKWDWGEAIWIGALPDSFSVISRNIAVHVHDRRQDKSRDVARIGPGILLFPFDADDWLLATLYELLKSLRAKGEDALAVGHMNAHQWEVLAIGFVVPSS